MKSSKVAVCFTLALIFIGPLAAFASQPGTSEAPLHLDVSATAAATAPAAEILDASRTGARVPVPRASVEAEITEVLSPSRTLTCVPSAACATDADCGFVGACVFRRCICLVPQADPRIADLPTAPPFCR